MKLRLPMYEGDGYIRPGLSTPAAQDGATRQAAPDRAAPLTSEQLSEIDREARRLRAAAMLRLIARFWDWLAKSSRRADQRALERMIGKPTDPADLEQRLRRFERQDGGAAV
jgi:hypothetical protein